MSVTCAPSPCGPALPVARLAGRYSCDYYGHSVAIGLASLRRSHVQQRYTSERDLGVPFASFNALTGHRSCVPEDYGMLLQFRRRDRRRFQASFRRGTFYPFWRLGFRQSSFRHITRIFPARRPVRLGTAAGFLGRGRLPGEVPFTALFPDSPLPNPPCEFPRHGLSGDYAVSNAAMCSA